MMLSWQRYLQSLPGAGPRNMWANSGGKGMRGADGQRIGASAGGRRGLVQGRHA